MTIKGKEKMTDQEYSNLSSHTRLKCAYDILRDICEANVSFIKEKELKDLRSKLYTMIEKGYKAIKVK